MRPVITSGRLIAARSPLQRKLCISSSRRKRSIHPQCGSIEPIRAELRPPRPSFSFENEFSFRSKFRVTLEEKRREAYLADGGWWWSIGTLRWRSDGAPNPNSFSSTCPGAAAKGTGRRCTARCRASSPWDATASARPPCSFPSRCCGTADPAKTWQNVIAGEISLPRATRKPSFKLASSSWKMERDARHASKFLRNRCDNELTSYRASGRVRGREKKGRGGNFVLAA